MNVERVAEVLARVETRLSDEVDLNTNFLLEAIKTIEDRLNIRLGTVELPIIFESIVVDAVVKVWRRKYYEGMDTERIDTIQTTFIENILDEYDYEIESYINSNVGSTKKNVVRFI